MNLTILSTSGIDYQSACNAYTWINGVTYFASTNLPTVVVPNSAGCDSTITLDLTIYGTSGTDTQFACDAFTWINGVTYTSSTNTPTVVLQNGLGCDSTVTLNLTIGNTTSIAEIISCEPYTWINGITYTSSTNTPTFTTQNTIGCDSIVTLHLTINAVPSASAVDNGNATITAGGIGSYQWINCSNNAEISGANSAVFAPTTNGSYAVIVDNGDCSDTSNCVTINNVSLNEFNLFNLNIYPNPTNNLVTISFDGTEAELIIYDAQGKLIQNRSTIHSGEQVSLANVQTGVYFFELSTSEGKTVKRVVKN